MASKASTDRRGQHALQVGRERRHRLGAVDLGDDRPAHRVQVHRAIRHQGRNSPVVVNSHHPGFATQRGPRRLMPNGHGEDGGVQLLDRVDGAGGQGAVAEGLEERRPVLEEEARVGAHRLVAAKKIHLSGLPQPGPLPTVGERLAMGRRRKRCTITAIIFGPSKTGEPTKAIGLPERRPPGLEVAHPVVVDVLGLPEAPHHRREVALGVRTVAQARPEQRALPVAVEDLHRLRIDQGDAVDSQPLQRTAQLAGMAGERGGVWARIGGGGEDAGPVIGGACRYDVVVLQIKRPGIPGNERPRGRGDGRPPGECRVEVPQIELLDRLLHRRGQLGTCDLPVGAAEIERHCGEDVGAGEGDHLPAGRREDGPHLLRLRPLEPDQLALRRVGQGRPGAPVSLPRDHRDGGQRQGDERDEDPGLDTEQRGLHALGSVPT